MTTRALVLALGLGAFLLTGGPARAGTDPVDACIYAKAKTTGKKASGLLKAYGKNIKKSNPAKLASDISKAQSKFTKGFVKAESKGGCATTGDAAAIEAKTDAYVASNVADCGDSIIAGAEDCDEGLAANGTAASCCNADCSLKAASTPCTDTGNVCTTAGCDGVNGDCDQGHLDAPASTPCPDTDGDTCTTSGCDGSGACDQGHAQAPASTPCTDTDGNACTTAGCDGVGGCDQAHVPAPASNPCPDTDGNVCTTAGCNGAGVCNQGHVNAPASNPCPDTDLNACTTAGCDGLGACNQLHVLAPASNPCADTDLNACTTAGCDGLGACNQLHILAPPSIPCADIDGNVCTTAGCDGLGACNQLHILAPASNPCPDTDANVCTTAGCNGLGACNQLHVLAPPGFPCGSPANTDCSNPDTCDGLGACSPNDEASSFPCPDTDGNVCTAAGCNGVGGCNQGHVLAPDGATPPGCDGVCNSESCQGGVCTVGGSSCCTNFPNGFLTFETGLASGNCGTLRNFKCSNDINKACAVNSDCGASNTCREQFYCSITDTIFCTANSDCPASQTCPSTYLGMPQNLECGGLYTGGGLNAVPLPFPVPDMGQSYTSVTSCNPTTGVVISGPTAVGDLPAITKRNCTTGRTCSTSGGHCVLDGDCPALETCVTNCLFGPPLPIPNAMTPPTSVCTVNAVDFDASATTQCDGGDTDISAPLRANVFLSGDLFTMTTPPNIPGVQPCPLCDTFCSISEQPCNGDSDCPALQTCDASPRCLGGPNDGIACTPATSDSVALGDNQNSYPTSHDCPPEPTDSITDAIGGLPIGFSLTSGTIVSNAQDLSAQGLGVFAGFCRDSTNGSSLCFEGDTDGGCPVALPPADGNAVPCNTKADCADADTYETCSQRASGAFSRAAATRISVFGEPDGLCLGDGALHDATLVSVFDIPPTFNPIVDGAGDLPGPGAAMLQGEAQILP